MSDELQQRLHDVYDAAGERDRLDEVYDDWSVSYDRDLWASGNPYIAIMNGLLGRHVPEREAPILDAGCGTGMLGQVMRQTGYQTIDGLDASQGMLDAARAKGCYRQVYHALLGARIDLAPASYAAIAACGVLTHGHAPPESLDGLLTLAAPGAPIVFTISQVAVEENGFGDKMAALDRAGAWHLVEKTEPFRMYPFLDDYADLRHWACVYRKPG